MELVTPHESPPSLYWLSWYNFHPLRVISVIKVISIIGRHYPISKLSGLSPRVLAWLVWGVYVGGTRNWVSAPLLRNYIYSLLLLNSLHLSGLKGTNSRCMCTLDSSSLAVLHLGITVARSFIDYSAATRSYSWLQCCSQTIFMLKFCN